MKRRIFILLTLSLVTCFSRSGTPAGSLFIADPTELTRLEGKGFSFAEIAFGASRKLDSAAKLRKVKGYREISDSLTGDLVLLKRADRLLGVGMSYSHRLFDPGWLKSDLAVFELAGVVLRLDRAPFMSQTCGEVRLIYRLAYKTPDGIYSRLPMTLNTVFWARDAQGKSADCRSVAGYWSQLSNKEAPWKAALSQGNLKSIEVNMQSVRWPSTVRPDFGGYAEYFLRVFKNTAGKFKPAPLENTPDVGKIGRDTTLKTELTQWLKEHRAEIDQGVMALPEKFLTRRATSVALNGPARLANLPYRQIFSDSVAAAIAGEGKYTASAARLLQRLDDMTCTGCHQGRAVAGFHFTGADRLQTDAVNSIYNPASPHFFADQPRRERFTAALAEGRPPAPEREISLRSDHEAGAFGAFCDPEKTMPGFDCDKDHACVPLNRDRKIANFGICQPVNKTAGSACRNGAPVSDINPHRDRINPLKGLECAKGYLCQNVAVGFPGGMCSNACSDLKPGETCGSIANLQGFNNCLAQNKPFAGCLKDNVRPGALKACDAMHSCRPDYICAKISEKKGGCIPPYFLFQLRVDGHNLQR